MSFYSELTAVNIMNSFIESNRRLEFMGAIYDGKTTTTPVLDEQKKILRNHYDGYDVAEQIFGEYSHQGALHEVVDNL